MHVVYIEGYKQKIALVPSQTRGSPHASAKILEKPKKAQPAPKSIGKDPNYNASHVRRQPLSTKKPHAFSRGENVLGENHRSVKKFFETEIWVDGKKLPLNNMMQETLANVVIGFSRTLKGTDTAPESVEVKVKKLAKPTSVDAHKYP